MQEKAKTEMLRNEMMMKQKREEELRLEYEETKRCEEELERRRNINAARAKLEAEHFERKQATRKRLSDQASQELKQRAEREFEIFERHQQLKQQKDTEQAEATRRKQELERIEIDKSRKQQLKAKKQQVEGKVHVYYLWNVYCVLYPFFSHTFFCSRPHYHHRTIKPTVN